MNTFLQRVTAILVTATLAGCSSATGTVTQGPIKIGVTVYPGSAPYFVAEELGLFTKRGVQAEVVTFNDMTQAIAALESGSMQFFYGTADFTAVIADAGVEVKEIAITDVGDGADGFLASAVITSIENLRGKTVYLAFGTPSHFLFRAAAADAGLTADDVKLVKMEPDQVGAAFAAGKIDAGMSWEPWLTKAKEQREGGKILFTSKNKPGIIADTLVVRSDFLRDRPEDVKAVLSAIFDAIKEMEAKPKETNAIAGKRLGITGEEFAEQATSVRFLSAQENSALFDRKTPRNLYELTERATEIFRTDGIIRNTIDAEEIVEPSVIRDILDDPQ